MKTKKPKFLINGNSVIPQGYGSYTCDKCGGESQVAQLRKGDKRGEKLVLCLKCDKERENKK